MIGVNILKNKLLDGLFDFFNTFLMLGVLLLTVYPFLYIVLYSISDASKISNGLMILPTGFSLDSYVAVFKTASIISAFFISVLRSTIGPACTIFISSMVAYVLSRDDLAGRKFFTKFFIFTMYFNSGLIPMYLLMKNLGLTGSFLVYIIPGMVSVFNMIIIKTNIEGIPDSLEESAIIDGANDIVVFFRIVFPLCKPVIAAILLFECIGQWNAFMDTMLYNAEVKELHTLQYVLTNFMANQSSSIEQLKLKAQGSMNITSSSAKMAVTVITVLPIIFVYPLLQKYFIKGLFIGAVKG